MLQGRVRAYEWGSLRAIPELFGKEAAEGPVAEVWLGAHPDDPASVGRVHSIFDESQLYPSRVAPRAVGPSLDEWVAQDPDLILGESVVERYGARLPYLLKLIAPAQPLSLQVHPSIAQAEEGYAAEEAAGVPHRDPRRNYKDRNHKPELVYALSTFQALAGFRARRRIGEVIEALGTPLTDDLRRVLRSRGVRGAFEFLLSEPTRPGADAVAEVAVACERRLRAGESPSRRADSIVVRLAERYPGDPGVVSSLLLNPVTLRTGEALFLSAGTVHAYLSGVGVEIMASSDNVLRAGLTHKHVDVPELLRILDPTASPPTRIAPERVSRAVSTFYAPVDDFELSDVHLRDANVRERIRGVGPRTVVCLNGAAQLEANGQVVDVSAGQAVFVPSCDGPLAARGFGHLVQAAVP